MQQPAAIVLGVADPITYTTGERNTTLRFTVLDCAVLWALSNLHAQNRRNPQPTQNTSLDDREFWSRQPTNQVPHAAFHLLQL